MDHSSMDHGHGGMDMGDQCSMNMLFTFSAENLCIVFRQWRVTGPFSLFMSMIVVILLSAGYEAIRDFARRYEVSLSKTSKDNLPGPAGDGIANSEAAAASAANPNRDSTVDEETRLLLPVARNTRFADPERRGRVLLAMLYAVQVFYSYFIMLVFMTYNGWIMLSVAVGAFLGYITFGKSSASKSVACH